MAGGRRVLSPDHIRALIKEAIGIIEGDRAIQAEAALRDRRHRSRIRVVEPRAATKALDPHVMLGRERTHAERK